MQGLPCSAVSDHGNSPLGTASRSQPEVIELTIQYQLKTLHEQVETCLNLAGNLADRLKMRPAEPAGKEPTANQPGDLTSSLARLGQQLQYVINNLNRAHEALG